MTAEPGSGDARHGGSGRGRFHPEPFPPIPLSQHTSPLNLDDFDVDLAVDQDQRIPSGNTITDIYSYHDENGRTYAGYDLGEYLLPNDGDEQDRLDLMHALSLKLLGGRLYRAPLVSPEHVLDIGTGTGLWAVEFAEQHPDSLVVGTDLSQIQPTGTPNCEFWVENSETQDWIFPYTLDYIHLRAMMTCFNDFQAVMHKSYDHMTPGGWIELYDGSWDFQCMDGSARGTALEQWANLLYLGGLRAGRDMRRAKHYKQYLLNAGFVDIDEKIVWCPGSPWPADSRHKEIGWFMMENILGMIDAHSKFLESAGLSPVEIEVLCSEARRDARNLGIHWFVPVYTVYGRKPMTLGAPLGDSPPE